MPRKSYRRPSRNPWIRLGLFSAAVGLFLVGYYWGNQYKQPHATQIECAILLRTPVPLPEFQATDTQGRPLDRKGLEGHWHLLVVGATDTPSTRQGLAQMNRIYNRLEMYPDLGKSLRPLLLSAAPEQETAEQLEETVRAYNPTILAAAGTTTGLADLLTALGVGNGSFDPHPATLYLLDPKAQLRALFTADQDPACIAHDISQILQTASDI